MNFSFLNTKDRQVLVRPTDDPDHVGLWRSPSGGKVYRTFDSDDLLRFSEKAKNLRILDFHRELLEPKGSSYWSLIYSLKVPVRIFIPTRTLKDLLPPWLTPLANKLPSEDLVYPEGWDVYPPKEQAFSGLWFDPKKVKVLVIGQDPYHGKGQAHGLAFSVKSGATPPSLRNIFQELKDTIPGFQAPKIGDLTPWFQQGVILVNSAFSVKQGEANSLATKWWDFTKLLFELLGRETSNDLVVMAWGGAAKGMAKKFPKAKILESVHPSPLSAHLGFFGCKHFKLANDHLRSKGLTPIDWRLAKK